jgi:hypothetical protein
VYPVTTDFLDKMKADRRQVFARVEIDYTDPFMDQSIEIEVNEQANVSYPQQTADSVDQTTHKYACLDGTWDLTTGEYHLAPSADQLTQQQFGWWGAQLAGVGGAFADPYPALTVTHLPRPIHTLKVVGDTAREEYPVDFAIKLYAADDTLLKTETVTGNTQIAWQKALEPQVLDVAKQELIITRWSLPGTCAKIVEFFTSIREVYETGDLMSLRLLEEREASQGSLPVGNISSNEITLALNNEDKKFDVDNEQSPLKNLLKPNRRIQVWLGAETSSGEEWVPLGTFWSLDWDSPDDTLEATVTARDRMELLRKGTYQTSQVQENKSLYELAEAVLQDAGLASDEYAIDEALDDIVIPYSGFNPVSHREALRCIAEAGLAAAFQNRDGKIQIESFLITGDEPVLEITEDDYFPPLRAPSRQDQVANEIIVDTQPLRPATTPEEVYRSNEPIPFAAEEMKTITIHYNQSPVIDTIITNQGDSTSIDIVRISRYAWGADITLANSTGQAAEAIIVATGRPLVAQNKERAIARDEASILENGVLRYEFPANPLVQTLDQAQAIADTLLASVKEPRRDIEVDWRGNPALLLGDRVTVKGKDYHVIRQEIDWAGALSARLTGRKAE